MAKLKDKSGLRGTYTVEMQDGTVLELQTELSDVMRWESQHNGQAWLTYPMSLSKQLWVVWRAARRLKLTDVMEPDVWMDQVVDLEDTTNAGDEGEGGEGQDPTPPAPSD